MCSPAYVSVCLQLGAVVGLEWVTAKPFLLAVLMAPATLLVWDTQGGVSGAGACHAACAGCSRACQPVCEERARWKGGMLGPANLILSDT